MTGWKQSVAPFGSSEIQDKFEPLFMAAGAPESVALFSRTTPDFEHEVFLLTPAAEKFANVIGGVWTDAVTPYEFSWSICVCNGDARKFGLELGPSPMEE